MKTIISTLILVCFNLPLNAQKVFWEKTIKDPATDGWQKSVIKIDDEHYVFTFDGEEIDTEKDFTTLFKINNTGDTVLSKKIYTPAWSGIYSLQNTGSNHFIAMGSYTVNDTANFWVLKLDHDFNIISDNKYPTNYRILNEVFSEIDSQGNIIVSGYQTAFSKITMNIFFYKLDKNGNILKSVFFENDGFLQANSILEKKNSPGYLLFTYGLIDSADISGFIIVTTDTNLVVQTVEEVPDNIRYNQTKWLTDTSYLLTGSVDPTGDSEQDFGIFKLNTKHEIIAGIDFGDPYVPDYQAWYTSLDFTYPDSIYYVGTSYISEGAAHPNRYNHIIINNLDSELNLNWQKYFGGDAYYEANCILATADGGCLVLSDVYDYNTQYQERDAHILKIGSSGSNSINDNNYKLKDIILYPNPAYDEVYVQTALQGNILFEMYNITGKKVIYKKISSGINNTNVSKLPAGIYLYRFIKNNKIIDSGKLIKN